MWSRDSLQHVPLHATWQFLNNVKASGARYLLVGSYLTSEVGARGCYPLAFATVCHYVYFDHLAATKTPTMQGAGRFHPRLPNPRSKHGSLSRIQAPAWPHVGRVLYPTL